MRLDRILSDLLSWVGQLVWSREGKVSPRPYERIQTWDLAGRGRLHRVIRPPHLCPRDSGTYIFEPYRYNDRKAKDIHICCDHLAQLEGMPPVVIRRGRVIYTHRITILIADHWVGKDGRYSAYEAFVLDDDLQGLASRQNFFINCILYQVAIEISACMIIEEFNFLRSVDEAKQHCMRQQYTHTIHMPEHSGNVIAYPYDEGKPVRIRL